MIKTLDKGKCCSCGACSQACPKSCITMHPDKFTGFRYPQVNTKGCVNCGICDKVCPISHERKARKPIAIYSYQNPNKNILKKSSSGGFFTELATEVLENGGVVFGAKFKEQWQVEIDYTESMEGLDAFRGSKYVQASTGASYGDARRFLEAGRMVLYTGTPCQIAGLKQFLKKDYDNLILVDLICHGTPSPKVWQTYIKEKSKTQDIRYVSFRDKSLGWENYSIVMGDYKSVFHMDPFMRFFLDNQDLAECCYDCPFKNGRSGSDYTIGDFWGAPEIFPNRQDGLGVVVSYRDQITSMDGLTSISYQDVIKSNPALITSPKKRPGSLMIYSFLAAGFNVTQTFKHMTSTNILDRCVRLFFRMIEK